MQIKKMKKYANSAILAIVGLFAFTTAGAQELYEAASDIINEEKLIREIGFLTDSICAGRATGTAGNVEAGAWIARKFEAAGLMRIGSYWHHGFRASNGIVGHNIMGFLPGSKTKHPDKYIIIGAHFDHLGVIDNEMYPGADANASGTVAMTALAEIMSLVGTSDKSFDHNIIFVGFDGNQLDLAGANRLMQQLANGELKDPVSGSLITKDKIAFMMNIDQFGSIDAPLRKNRTDYIVILDGDSDWDKFKSGLTTSNKFLDINLQIGFSYYESEYFTKMFYRLSDQRVFIDNNIPALLFTSGITMNNNKTRDTVDTLNMEIFLKRIYLIYHWLRIRL